MNYPFVLSYLKNTFLFWLILCICNKPLMAQVLPGAVDTVRYLPELKGKKIGVVAHQASLIYNSGVRQHLVDVLLEKKN